MKNLMSIIFVFWSSVMLGQSITPDLHDLSAWNIGDRKVETLSEQGKKVMQVDQTQREDERFVSLKGYSFSNGSIEFDVKGKNIPQQSFVGVAFHIENEKYEVIYFRPFNFMNPDTVRRPRSVQYVSLPTHTWQKLREDSPGKYENKVNPVPDPEGWFHVKVVVEGKEVKVFVNNSTTPSLEVERLSTVAAGEVGLWAGTMTVAKFANLVITPSKKK